ncbi:MAG: formate/nitrite transporter family protein [Bacteroidaceae bacterium]|nr:formate/nitrite transporter family protein [Bacteroidaceae bacterium]
MINTIRLAIFAGIAIAIGGTVFLNVGGVEGAVLFAFGLLTVVHYKLKLYTGTAGYVTRSTWGSLGVILFSNIVGCFLTALLVRYSLPSLVETADAILQKRLALGPVKCGLLGIGCGLIMTTAVEFGRKQQWLPLLFGVPVFILCGFTHCIADAFYYCMASTTLLADNAANVLLVYISIVLGNLAGCNLYRLFVSKE